VIGLTGCSSSGIGPQSVAGMQPVGTVDMRQVQAAYIGSGSTGNGMLYFNGQSYPFSVSGLGIGGIGVSTIDAQGEVYGLKSIDEFPAPMARHATASRSGRRAKVISGCKTTTSFST
jgi:hypothetical protein